MDVFGHFEGHDTLRSGLSGEVTRLAHSLSPLVSILLL